MHEQTLVSDEQITIRTQRKIFELPHDKEQDGIQFLQTGVTIAQLLPLLKHCKFSYKTRFYIKFYNAL